MAIASSEGFLLVDKPAGISSHDAVAKVRRARGGMRAGHTGTLDPFATGLLLVALGRATRLIRFVPSEPKVYAATIAFGTATDTDDVTGKEVEQGPIPADATVLDAIPLLTGSLPQHSLATSAAPLNAGRPTTSRVLQPFIHHWSGRELLSRSSPRRTSTTLSSVNSRLQTEP